MEAPQTPSPEDRILSDSEVNQLVLSHLTEIRYEARRHLSRKHDLSTEDLFQWGVIGAIDAGRRFDPERGVRFYTYAVHYIRRAMRTAIINEGSRIKLAAHVHDKMSQLNRCRHELQRPAEIDELHEMSGISETSIENTMEAQRIRVTSLQRNVRANGDDHQTLEDLIADDTIPAPDSGLTRRQNENEVHERLQCLDEKDPIAANVVRWRFGLANDNAMTLAEIGGKMNLTRERIRQINDRGIRKLARLYREKGI